MADRGTEPVRPVRDPGKGASMIHRRQLAALAGAGLLSVCLGACSSSSTSSSTSPSSPSATSTTPPSPTTTATVPANEIRIGLEGPLTGDQSSVGIGMLQAAQMAAANVNASGGAMGKTVTIVPIDDKADPVAGVAAAKSAIASGLTGVVGPYNSGVGAKTLPLYLSAGLVPIRLTSANTTEGMGVTLQPMTSQIAPVATTAITTWQKATSVALIYDKTQAYTTDANAAMKSDLAKAGVTVVSDTAITPGKKSYTSTVAAVTARHPQLVYVVTYYPEAGLIAKAMYDAKSTAKCLTDFGGYDNGFVTAAGIPAAQSCPVVGVPAPEDFPGSASLITQFQSLYKAAPGTWSPYAYDSVNILLDAATKAGGFDSTKLLAALDAESGWRGWTGQVKFAAKTGDRVPPSVAVVVPDASGVFHIDTAWETSVGYAF